MKAWLLILFASLAGCAASSVSPFPKSPYHIALIPVRMDEQAEPQEEDSLPIRLDRDALSQAIAERLEQRCFARVTRLHPSEVDLAAGGSIDSLSDSDWVALAQEVRADLILECKAVYRPWTIPEKNDRFWLNLPLFLLGGPFCYFVKDVTYFCEARLQGEFHEVSGILRSPSGTIDGTSLVLGTQTRFEEVSLALTDRAQSSLLLYLPTLVIPPGTTAKRTPMAVQSIERSITKGIAEGFTAEVEGRRDAFFIAERLWDFYLDPNARALRVGDRCRLIAEVVMVDDGSSRLDGYRLWADQGVYRADFPDSALPAEPPVSGNKFRRFPIDAFVECSPSAHSVSIEVIEGGRTPRARTFTITIEANQSDVTTAK